MNLDEALDATIRRVARPRGKLTEEQRRDLAELTATRDEALDAYRTFIVGLLNSGCSFNEVSHETGLSTNTLQRWKREA